MLFRHLAVPNSLLVWRRAEYGIRGCGNGYGMQRTQTGGRVHGLIKSLH